MHSPYETEGITLGSVSVIMRLHMVIWPPKTDLSMPKKPALLPEDENYNVFLKDLKSCIRRAQVKAALAVNSELIVLYWQIGREIITRQEREGWGGRGRIGPGKWVALAAVGSGLRYSGPGCSVGLLS